MNQTQTIREIFNSKSYLFKNKMVLRHEYIPNEVLVRKEEVASLARILKDALNMDVPPNAFIYGGVGVGKTLITKYTLKQLMDIAKEKNLEDKIYYCYINCKTMGSECQILAEIINRFAERRAPSKGKGWGKATYYNIFANTLDQKEGIYIIVLDEVDQLATDAENVLYNLSRANTNLLTSAKLSLIGISNDAKFYEDLDARTRSSMCQRELIINPYTAPELETILNQRAALAFNNGTLAEETIPYCAALAAREHGDARRAVDLMRAAGEIAEKENAREIDKYHVSEAQKIIERNRVVELIKRYPNQKKLILLAVFLNEISDKKIEINTSNIYAVYKRICQKNQYTILTQRRVTEILNELGLEGILNVRVISKGRYGMTKNISSATAPEHIKKALEADEFFELRF